MSASCLIACTLQAFHWFSNEPSIREIHRVLAPGACFGVCWNQRDPPPPPDTPAAQLTPWHQLQRLVDGVHARPDVPRTPRQATLEWKKPLEAFPGFGPLEHRVVYNPNRGYKGTAEQVIVALLR
jgi:SAM-dependent methyltransferase